MATAEKVSKITNILLALSVDEAVTVLTVCNHISGHPGGRRGHMDSIGRALRGCGIEPLCSNDCMNKKLNEISFTE